MTHTHTYPLYRLVNIIRPCILIRSLSLSPFKKQPVYILQEGDFHFHPNLDTLG